MNLMTTATLGKNGPAVSGLGIGTWAWGDKLFWDYGNSYSISEVKEAFKATVQEGITFFDTAEVYGLGDSETLIGQFIKELGVRVDIATKFGPVPWRFNGDAVKEALRASLNRLQLQQVALYQVHWPFTFFMSQETLMNALADEVEAGRVKTIGVSNYSAEEMGKAYEILGKRGIPLAVNQVQYSLVHRKIESNGILGAAKELGVTILAYSPIAQGLLTGKYNLENYKTPEGARRFDSRFSKSGLEKIAPVVNLLGQFGEKYQKTPAQVALNWLIAQGNVIPIPGAKNGAQARQNAGALGWSLTADEVAQLELVSRPWLS